ncbi:MAG: hypothetical protein RBS80_04765 [Thermoguttaceae bacterium]|jgi:hypothetical protein|nr:hypothetical protein [Thermoguttaceae bacterium]
MTFQSGLSRADTAMLVHPGRRLVGLERAGFVVLLTMLLGTSGLLALRRVAGALVEPLPAAAMLFVAVALVVLAGAVRSLGKLRFPGQGRAGGRRWPLHLLATFAVLVAAVSLSLSGSGWLGLTGLWGAVLAGEILAWRPLHLPPLRWPRRLPRPARPRARPVAPECPISHGAVSQAPALSGIPAAEVFQQLTRRQLAEGGEEMAGWVRAVFAAGQRTENVHVAFCPPFSMMPQLTVRQLDGPPARMKTAQLLPFGVRIDLKLPEPAEEDTCVLLEFNARTNTRPARQSGAKQ